MRFLGLGLAALAVVVASPALAERLSTDADYVLPAGRHFIPDRALRLQIEGWARLRCAVHEAGAVGDCVVVGESAIDLGFGDAALKASRVARLTSPAQPGDVVYIHLEFRFQGGGARTVATSVTPPQRAIIEAARPALAEPIGMALVSCEAPVNGAGPLTRCRALAEAPSNDGYGAAGAALAERAYVSALPPMAARVRVAIRPEDRLRRPHTYAPEEYDLELVGDPSTLPPVPSEPVWLSCALGADNQLRGCRPDAPSASKEATAAALALGRRLRFARLATFVINWGQ